MAGMDDPRKMVNAIVRMSLSPQEELAVGWKAKASYTSHQLLPDLTERISANIAHRYQIETAPPAPPTTGRLYEPMESGRGIEDGVRERMKREDAARDEQRR